MKELLISIILVVLLVAIMNPFGLLMPGMVQMVIMGAVAVAFAVFAGFVWRERARDEREERNRMQVGRIAFLAGGAMLVIGTFVQVMAHAVDPWLPGTLAVMITAKLIGLVHVERTG